MQYHTLKNVLETLIVCLIRCLIVLGNENVILLEKQHLECMMIGKYDDLDSTQFAQNRVVLGEHPREFCMVRNVLTLSFSMSSRLRIGCELKTISELVSGVLSLPYGFQLSLTP